MICKKIKYMVEDYKNVDYILSDLWFGAGYDKRTKKGKSN